MRAKWHWPVLLCMALAACSQDGKETAAKVPERRATPVTATLVQLKGVETVEETVGRVEAITAPVVDAEVAGRVARIHAKEGQTVAAGDLLAELDPTDLELALQAARGERKRLEALITNQERLVQRYRTLRAQSSVSEDALESAEAQLVALRQQLVSARAQEQTAARNLARSRIVAPIDGSIEERRISVGDFVDRGAPLFRLTDSRRLRALLPLPEKVAERIRVGLPVRLSAPQLPKEMLNTSISAIRPMVGGANQAVVAIAEFNNPGPWRPGGSVDAAIVVEQREQAVLIPQISLVQRPSGTVAYTVDGDVARERPVTTGERRDGWIEVRSGLDAGEQVVVDGAGFLTDGAAIRVTTQP